MQNDRPLDFPVPVVRPHVRVEASMRIRAPSRHVAAVYGDVRSWPLLFPTISRVRLLREEPERTVVEVEHVEGLVLNVLRWNGPNEAQLDERKKRYDATFINSFEPLGASTRYRVVAHIRLRGAYRVLAPLLRRYVRRQIERLVLEPVKARAEREHPSD